MMSQTTPVSSSPIPIPYAPVRNRNMGRHRVQPYPIPQEAPREPRAARELQFQEDDEQDVVLDITPDED